MKPQKGDEGASEEDEEHKGLEGRGELSHELIEVGKQATSSERAMVQERRSQET